MGPPLFEKNESYDCAYPDEFSYFKTCWREAYLLLLSLNNFYWLAFDISTSSLKSANFFVVITSAYTELQICPSRLVPFYHQVIATQLILSFLKSIPSFNPLFFFVLLSLLLFPISKFLSMSTVYFKRSVLIFFHYVV